LKKIFIFLFKNLFFEKSSLEGKREWIVLKNLEWKIREWIVLNHVEWNASTQSRHSLHEQMGILHMARNFWKMKIKKRVESWVCVRLEFLLIILAQYTLLYCWSSLPWIKHRICELIINPCFGHIQSSKHQRVKAMWWWKSKQWTHTCWKICTKFKAMLPPHQDVEARSISTAHLQSECIVRFENISLSSPFQSILQQDSVNPALLL
jgi:hypothetical protein